MVFLATRRGGGGEGEFWTKWCCIIYEKLRGTYGLTFLAHIAQSVAVMQGPAACWTAGTRGLFFRSSHFKFFKLAKLTGNFSSLLEYKSTWRKLRSWPKYSGSSSSCKNEFFRTDWLWIMKIDFLWIIEIASTVGILIRTWQESFFC